MWTRLTGAIAFALQAACNSYSVSEPGWERGLAVVDPARSSVQMITAPLTAQAGAPFLVVVRSFGSSSCTRVADATVVVNGLNVDITPYNEYARSAPYCTADLHTFEHQLSVTVAQVGAARMRLHARGLDGKPLTYDLTLTVQP